MDQPLAVTVQTGEEAALARDIAVTVQVAPRVI